MKPLFTIHAGEYLLGNVLEKKLENCELWLPAKDTGIDFLVTNKKDRSKNLGVQAKFSKDFLPEMNLTYNDNIIACGWWTLKLNKIKNSDADYWILTPFSFLKKGISLIIIKPKVLYEKLIKIHGSQQIFNTYLWVTKDNHCFETRGLKKKDKDKIIKQDYADIDVSRDFSQFLDTWKVFDAIC